MPFINQMIPFAYAQARHEFEETMDDLRSQLEALPSPRVLEDVDKLSDAAKTAARAAYFVVFSAIGLDQAESVAVDEGWEDEATAVGDRWKEEATSAGGGGGGGDGGDGKGGDNGDGGGNGVGSGNNGRRNTPTKENDADPDNNNNNNTGDGDGDGGGGGEDVSLLVRSILSAYYAPCIMKVTLERPNGEEEMAECRVAVDRQWAMSESKWTPEQKRQGRAALDDAVVHQETGHVQW